MSTAAIFPQSYTFDQVRLNITGQSLPDDLVMIHTKWTGDTHSVGLGAIFPKTALEAWKEVDNKAYQSMPGNMLEVQQKLYQDNVFNIETIAVVHRYYAI